MPIDKKKETLISMAITAVNWGEGSDFEMYELIVDYWNDVKNLYPEHFKGNECIDSDKLCSQVKKDITKFLYKLMNKYQDPVEVENKKAAAEKWKKEYDERQAKEKIELNAKIDRWKLLEGKRVKFIYKHRTRKESQSYILVIINNKEDVRDHQRSGYLISPKEGTLELCPTGFASEAHIFRARTQFSTMGIEDLVEV